MTAMNWQVKLLSGGKDVELNGTHELTTGANHIYFHLPKGQILSIKAELDVPISTDEKIFMNGYQTWTYCPEYSVTDSIRGLHRIPSFGVKKFHFDGYGDYHFVNYPYKSGVTHGFSWCSFRNGKHVRLLASLDEDPGYTMFTYDANLQHLTIERDCYGIESGGEYALFDLYFKEGGEQDVYDGWFDELPQKRIPAEPLYGYSSWYNRYQNIDETSILQDLSGCKTIFKPGDLFQIDDGWEPKIGDWLEEDRTKFPKGMKAMVEEIHAAGFEAGLWLAPFVAETESALYQTHPDWFLKVNGENFTCGCNWSGFDSLDIDHPEVRQYLRDVFHRVFDEWGFDLVKLDFLYGAAPYGSVHETRAARMRRAMEFLRELCGEPPILGCGVPVMPAFGLVEYCRISCDVTLDWNDKLYMQVIHRERPSTKQAIGNIISRRQLNGRAYLSDPDVFFLRSKNISLTEKQKEKLATISALLGGVFLTSDDPSSYTEEMKEQYHRLRHLTKAKVLEVLPDHGITIRYELDGAIETVSFE